MAKSRHHSTSASKDRHAMLPISDFGYDNSRGTILHLSPRQFGQAKDDDIPFQTGK
jgi:hypothetical protein